MDLKKLLVPFSNERKKIDVAQLWEVRWTSVKIDLNYHMLDGHQPEIETFLTEKEARDFADSLGKAYELTKVDGIEVAVRKAR